MQISTCTSLEQYNLLLKTQPKQVLGYLLLAFMLPARVFPSPPPVGGGERVVHKVLFHNMAIAGKSN